tara:strand:- start:31038 stop:31208 length:171 start_codon:yes stop_codon:yes gene_type:complete
MNNDGIRKKVELVFRCELVGETELEYCRRVLEIINDLTDGISMRLSELEAEEREQE